jgi:hypothetical protein
MNTIRWQNIRTADVQQLVNTTAVNTSCGFQHVVHMIYVKHTIEDSGLLGYYAILATSYYLEESECPRL